MTWTNWPEGLVNPYPRAARSAVETDQSRCVLENRVVQVGPLNLQRFAASRTGRNRCNDGLKDGWRFVKRRFNADGARRFRIRIETEIELIFPASRSIKRS